MKLTAVIPAKNEAETIRFITERVKQHVDECVVVIPENDHATYQALGDLECVVVRQRASGKGLALREGVAHATGTVIVFVDADLSHDPSDIPRLVKPIQDGSCDHVVGSRMLGGSSELFDSLPNFIRLVGSHLITLLINRKFGSRLTDSQNGFRAIRKDVFERCELKEIHTTIEQELTAQTLAAGFRVIEVPSHEYARKFGDSKIVVLRHGWRYVYVLMRILLMQRHGWSHDHDVRNIQATYNPPWHER